MTHPTLLSPDRFNDECFCLSLDEAVLRHALEEELGSPGLADLVQSRCPYLFSAQPVLLPQRQQQRMAAVITAMEQVVALPSWQERVLQGCDEVVHHAPGRASGVFMGFDFHLRGEQLELRDGHLWRGDLMIDLAYNRLTDFALEQPQHAVLRQALLDDAALVTPHPRAYVLYADKFNLTLLTDQQALQELGVPQATQQVLLQGIPRTECVIPEQAERLWQQRKQLFFKPASGFGSKAAYRGDKLTRGVWADILKGRYVAQALVPPGERKCSSDNPATLLKFDLRNYVYQGQTTNFRTPGSGFAPVYAWPEMLEKIPPAALPS